MSERSEAIRLKVMADGHIRAYDAVKHQGVSEWYIDNPRGGAAGTITTCSNERKMYLIRRL